ncbi:hypothetical protein [Clostridium tagluense]|uniref:Uncharacterized protein n=1 Tax=Clostridium tagluense TaxID=360422 RepID=A0A401UUR7_9CLOT|nr:hypothetical protein [Clostridium tagluense]GCD13297.1 hypothetical protein Ctaglu_49200 [Clostridium tagluense]
MLDIKTWLETIGLKVAEERFIKPPPLPYIIFTDKPDVSGADDRNCIADRSISVELYSSKVNKVSEKAIEDLLNEKAINYKKDRMWIDTEMWFETTYDFNLIEKF